MIRTKFGKDIEVHTYRTVMNEWSTVVRDLKTKENLYFGTNKTLEKASQFHLNVVLSLSSFKFSIEKRLITNG